MFHYIARALVIENGSILLARAKGADNVFLPGGHIELGEKAHDALKREIYEEIGYHAEIGEFIGAIEHTWPKNTNENHEINLIFSTKISELHSDINPKSLEAHLDLFWVDIKKLGEFNLQPYPLINLIKNGIDVNGFWASTLR